jgi:hypothetical protein
MPCEHCKGAHTLMNCVNLDMVAVHQQFQQRATRGYQPLKLYLDAQRVTLLKRLARDLGGVMNQNKRDLVLFCLVRASPHYPATDNVQTNRSAARAEPRAEPVVVGAHDQIRQLFQQINRIRFSWTSADMENVLWMNQRGRVVDTQHIPAVVPLYNTAQPPMLRVNRWEQIAQQGALLVRINQISPVFSQAAIDLLLRNLEVGFLNDLFSFSQYELQIAQSFQQVPVLSVHPRNQTISIKKGNALVVKDDVCCICMESTCYVQTNCNHSFCNCILQHMSKNGPQCPCCRQGVTGLAYSVPEHYDAVIRLLPILRQGAVQFVEI